MNCLHCSAETTNGLALCDLCQRNASDCLESLPVYFRNLARQRRPGRPNGSLGGVGGPSDDSIPVTALVGRASNDVDTWARAFAEDRGMELPTCETEVDTFAATCDLLRESLPSIGTLEWGGQFIRDMTKHERILRAATETLIPGWYAGGCKRCGSGTYVVPGLTWVTCPACGVTTFARDHLDTILNEARWWLARPKAIAEALVALIDDEQSVQRLYDRIRQWESRDKKLVGYRKTDEDGDDVGPKRYYLGDVLDVLTAEADAARGARLAADEAKAS